MIYVLKKKKIFFCEIPFGILSFSRYADIETMNIVSFDVEMNQYKLLDIKSRQTVSTLKLLGIPIFKDFLNN